MEEMRGYWALGLLMAWVGGGLLTRAIFVQAGRLKGPLLRPFERYGDAPYRYNSLRDLVLCAAVFYSGIILFVAHFAPLAVSWLLPSLALGAAAVLAHWLESDLQPLMPKPGWFARFMRATTEPERRRIAYAWLNITPAMRAHFNAQDEAFFRWVDLVMLGVVSDGL
jgi:hypothetical protein